MMVVIMLVSALMQIVSLPDPLFINPGQQDFMPQEVSPVIDTGDPNTPIMQDYLGIRRPGNQGPDMGAFELAGCEAIINDDISTIYGNIQTAVDNTEVGDTVKVAGRCTGVNNRTGVFTQTLYISRNIRIIGGYPGNGDFTDPPDPERNVTVLSSLERGSVVHVAPSISTTVSGFHIIRSSGPAIYNEGALSLTQNRIYSNTATQGAGIYNTSSLTLTESHLYANNATLGGAIYNDNSSLVVASNRIYNNTATNAGAGLYSTGGPVRVQNNFIYRNIANTEGGGVNIQNGLAEVWHNTLVDNEATDNGSAIFINDGVSGPEIIGNIATNVDLISNVSLIYAPAGITVGYNLYDLGGLAGGATGVENLIDIDPGFVDPANFDYHLTENSEAIDEGDPTFHDANGIDLDVDIDGHPRPSDQYLDIGADEVIGCFVRLKGTTRLYASPQYVVSYLAQNNDTIHIAGICKGVNDQNQDGTEQNPLCRQIIDPTRWLVCQF